MIYVIVALLIVVIVLAALLNGKRKCFVPVEEMPAGDLEQNVKELAMSLRMPERAGSAPDANRLKRKIKSAQRVISSKVKREDGLYAFEKWLYENYNYNVSRLKNRDLIGFSVLPHSGRQPRVLIFADFVLRACKYDLKRGFAVKCVENFNKYTPLYYEEIMALPDAFSYCLTLKIAELAEKSTKFAKMERVARRKKPKRSLAQNDSYLYFLKKYGKSVDFEERRYGDVNEENAEISFYATVASCDGFAESAINSLKNIRVILTDQTLFDVCFASKAMSADDTYASLDTESKSYYLEAVSELSGMYNVSEKNVVDVAFELGAKNGIHFGNVLFDHKLWIKYRLLGVEKSKIDENNRNQPIYVALVAAIDAVFATATALIFIGNWLYFGITLFFGLFAFVKLAEFCANKFFALFLSRRPVPRMNYETVPDFGKTTVAVSHLICDENDLTEAVFNLKKIAAVNKDDNIEFCLLIDYAPSNTETAEQDALLNSALGRLLGGEKGLNAFVRKRKFNGKNFSGYERKRGAIEAFNRLLLTANADEFAFIVNKDFHTPEFVVLLDADNETAPSSIKTAINVMLHPANSDYDLFAFKSKYKLSSIKSLYSEKFRCASGAESYNSYSDFYYNLSGNSVYCGKGIYRLSSFAEKLEGKLPENRILSHDVIEGAIVKTASFNEVIYEDAPSGFFAETERQNRWARGDLQLLPFIKNRVKNAENISITLKKPLIYNYIMLSNAFSVFSTIAVFAMLLAAAIASEPWFLLLPAMYYAVPAFLETLSAVNNVNRGERVRYAFADLFGILSRTVFDALMLPFYAINNLAISVMTFYRMARGKKLLEWKTFRSVQGGNAGAVTIFFPSVVVMALLCGIFFTNFLLLGYTLAFYAAAIVITVASAPRKSKQAIEKIDDENRNYLLVCAAGTYRYFSDLCKKENNYLIPDNYQLSPFKGAAERTSPTNIGFLLLSRVSAAKLGLITNEEAEELIKRSLSTVGKLKKHKGNLYNWYDTRTLAILPPHTVSSVDSANFVAALIVVKEFFIENGDKGGASETSKLIRSTDLGFFYDEERGLFRIAFDKENGKFEGYYDMLASESRLLSYLAVAGGTTPAAWQNLSRECVSAFGNTLLSWSGTAFEYLLPQIFLADVRGALLTSSVKNAVKIQIKSKCNGVFGVSESAYYKFDDDLNYQYYAYGLEQLSMRTEFNRCVISPYSTMLALRYAPEKCCENLQRLKNQGLFGRYGYFEAVDYNGSKNIIYSHMAHHQGMSLCALANFLADDCIVKLFNSDAAAAGSHILLEEPLNKRKAHRANKGEYVYPEENAGFIETVTDHFAFPHVKVLTSGDYVVIIDQNGNGCSRCKNRIITRFRKDIYRRQGVFAYFKKTDGSMFSTKFSPLAENPDDYSATFRDNSALFENYREKVTEKIVLPFGLNGEARFFTIKNESDKPLKLDFALYADLSMNTYEGDFSHTVFDNMFIKTSRLDNFIVAERRPRSETGGFFSAMGIFGVDFRAVTSKFVFEGRLRSPENPDIFGAGESESTGDVLEPCFGAVGEIELPPNDEKEFFCVILAADDREELERRINLAADKNFRDFALSAASLPDREKSNYLKTERRQKLCSQLASKLIYEPFSAEKLKRIKEKSLFSHIEEAGLDKRLKTLYFDVSLQDKDNVADFLSVYAFLNSSGIECNLFLICGAGDCDDINAFSKTYLSALGVAGRVRYLNAKGAPSSFIEELKTACFAEIFGDLSFDTPAINKFVSNLDACPTGAEEGELIFPDIVFRTGNGGFDADGAYIVKSRRPTALPYSNVIAMPVGGTVVTENGGGFTFSENSRENKLTVFSNSPVDDTPSESVFWVENGFSRRINKGFGKNAYTVHSLGQTRFVSLRRGIKCAVSTFMIRNGKVKIYEVTLENSSVSPRSGAVAIKVEPSLFWRPEKEFVYSETVENGVIAVNAQTGLKLALKCLSEAASYVDAAEITDLRDPSEFIISGDNSSFNNSAAAVAANVKLGIGESKTLYFAISSSEAYIDGLNADSIDYEKRKSAEYFDNLKTVRLESGIAPLDAMINEWLPAQVVSARLNGRCGYYQAGGAIGFRDQLQDCLAMLYIDQTYVRRHILLCAAHQFEEGDVQHWWHPPYFGVRTKISDDMLFLPYLTAKYLKSTGDRDILEETIPFISARKPAENEEGALENAVVTEKIATLAKHLEAAIDCALKFGEHDLLLIGSGDWNDALNEIGTKGRGESVWLSMFAYLVIKEISPYLDDDFRVRGAEACERLEKGVNAAFENGRFKRAFTDKGEWLGSDGVKYASIDLICQAFAAISGIAAPEKTASALDAALGLADFDNGIIKLFSPPFDGKEYYGYISKYPEGVRENGGQYTHAAAWLVKAFAEIGNYDRAFELFRLINPAEKCATDFGNSRYKAEPYVFAGDVYTNKDNFGRAGWSWYTGSASWLYTVFIEDILGVKIERNRLVFRAVLPKALENPRLVYRYGTSEYRISFVKSDIRNLFVNGIENRDDGKLAAALSDNGKLYEIEVRYICAT